MPRVSRKNGTVQKQFFPIFKEASNYTLNDYWKNMMNKFYLGEFPDGISYKNFIMSVYINGKNKKIPFPNNPPEFCNTFILEFKKLNYDESKENRQKKKDNIVTFKTWKDVRNHSLKERLIREYATYVCTSLKLSDSNKYELISKINLGIMFKSITISMNNGKIYDVMGIDFIDGHFVLVSQNYKFKEVSIVYCEKEEKVDYPGIWKDYIEEIGMRNKHHYKGQINLIKVENG